MLDFAPDRDLIFYSGFAVFFDPGITPVQEQRLVVRIEAVPIPFRFLVVGMDHAHRAPGEFLFSFLIHLHPYFVGWLDTSLSARYVPHPPNTP